SSRILELHGERMIKRNFDPGFRIELHQKDLNLALQGARSLSLSLPNTATTQELFNAAAALGGKAWDHSGLVRVLEHLARHEWAKGYPPRPAGGERVGVRGNAMRGKDENRVERARSLRRATTPAESKLWNKLRNRQLGGFKFTRQEPIGSYYFDFVCRER